MMVMIPPTMVSRTCTSSSACRHFSYSTVSVLFSASISRQLPRVSFYERRDLAVETRDHQPFLLTCTMLLDPIESSISAATCCSCVLLFVASSLRSFALVVGVVRANALRQSVVTTQRRRTTTMIDYRCCARYHRRFVASTFSLASSSPPMRSFCVLLFLCRRRQEEATSFYFRPSLTLKASSCSETLYYYYYYSPHRATRTETSERKRSKWFALRLVLP